MKPSKIKAVSLAAASCMLAAATSHAQTVINFGAFSAGTAITNQFSSNGISFSAVDAGGNIGAPNTVYVPQTDGAGLTNSPTHAYPTTKLLDVNFATPTIFKTINFNSEGYTGAGNGHVIYKAYDSTNTLIATGLLNSSGATAIVLNLSGVSKFEIDNGSVGAQSWIFSLDSFTIHAPFQLSAVTTNQYAVASALENSYAGNNPGIQNLAGVVDALSPSDKAQAYDKISGEELTSVFNSSFTTAHQDNLNVTNHLYALQNGNTGGFSLALVKGGTDGKSVVSPKGAKDQVQPAGDNRWSFFVNANGDFTKVQNDANANGFSYQTAGLTFGADYKLFSNVVVGAYLGYNHVFTTLVNGGDMNSDGMTGGLYGSWYSQGFYVNGLVGGGYSSFTSRRLSVGGNALGLSDSAYGASDSAVLNTLIGTGYDVHCGGWTFGPQVRLEYTEATLNSFTENGSLAPLNIGSQSQDSLRSNVGAHLYYAGQVCGYTVHPDLHASWQHEYDSTAGSLGAGIAGTNAGFVVQAPSVGRDSAMLGIGVAVDLNEKSSVYANYESQVGSSKLSQNYVSLGYLLKF